MKIRCFEENDIKPIYELLKNEVQSLEIKDIRKKFVLEQLELYYR